MDLENNPAESLMKARASSKSRSYRSEESQSIRSSERLSESVFFNNLQ